MKEFGLMFGIFSLFAISPKSLVFGRTHSPFCQSSIVSTIVSAYTRATVRSPVMNTRQEPQQESLFEMPKTRKETAFAPNNKRNDSSVTKASSKRIVSSLSTSFDAQSQLNKLIKSSLSTNILPASFLSRYASINAKKSVLSGHENSFETSSIPFYTMPPEIISSPSQVNGIIKSSLSRDKTHLSTSRQEDKSRVSYLEPFTKSAFFYPPGQFTRSSSILVRNSSLYGTTVSFDKAKIFTKGSVTLTNGLSSLSVGSTIRKTEELKLLSEAISYSSPHQHSMGTFDAKISSEAIKVNFSGIYGILQTTATGKITSPFISTLGATEVPTISVKASAVHRPPSRNKRNVSSSLSVIVSPVVSSKISNETTITFTTPLTQPSVVTVTSNKLTSRSKAKFRTLSEENTNSAIHRWSTILTPTTSYRTSGVAHLSNSHQSDGALKESVFSFFPQGPPCSSGLCSFPEKDSHFTEGMRTLPSRQPEISHLTYLSSPSVLETLPCSVKFTQNAGKQTPMSSKKITSLSENLSSPSLLKTIFKYSMKYQAVSETSKQLFSLLTTGSSHLSPMSSSTVYRSSQITQTSAMFNKLVASSFQMRVHSEMSAHIASSTLDAKYRVSPSSFSSLSVVTLPAVSVASTLRRFATPKISSTILTQRSLVQLPLSPTIWHQSRFLSSQSSGLSSSPSSSSSSSSSSPSSSLSSSLSPSSPPSPSSSSSSSSSSPSQKISIDKHSTVAGIFSEPSSSKSSVRNKVSQISPQRSTVFTRQHMPSSSWQSFSHILQEKSSTVTASSHVTLQTYFGFSNSSVFPAHYATPSSLPAMNRSKVLYHISSFSSSLSKEHLATDSQTVHRTSFSSPHDVTMATKAVVNINSSYSWNRSSTAQLRAIHQRRLSSSLTGQRIDHYQSGWSPQSPGEQVSQPMSHFRTPHVTTFVTSKTTQGPRFSTLETEHNVYFSSVHSSFTSVKLLAPSTKITNSLFQTKRDKASVITSGELLTSSSKIVHHHHFFSTEISTPSLNLQTYSHYQAINSAVSALDLASSYPPRPLTSEAVRQVNAFTSQSSIASTVSPSFQPKISSHILQSRSSTGSRLPSSRPMVNFITASIVDNERIKASSVVNNGTSSIKEFTEKVTKVPAASGMQLGATVILSGNMSTSSTPDVAENLPTPTTSSDALSNIKLLVIVATVPSIVLCAFFTAVMLLRRNRRRKNNFKYSIKLEYKDSLRSRCVNSRLDLSLKEIHIDLELPNISNDRRDSNDCSRRTSLAGTQIRELQILSQECKENLEWISEVIARDMGTSICTRKSTNRDSVYSIKEKGNYEPSAKIVRRESSKRGRETITLRVPIVRRRDSGEFDQNDSICTDDTTLTSNSEWKDERELDRAKCNRVDKGSKIKRTPSHVNEDRRAAPPSKNFDEIQGQGKETKELELEEKKQNNTLNTKNPQGKRSGRRFETL